MAYLNEVRLIGNVGKEPQSGQTEKGSVYASFSLATNKRFTDKESGEVKEQTEWHNIVCFLKLAEFVRDHVKKGATLLICGSLRTRKWKNKEGKDQYTTEIVADSIQFLDKKEKDQETKNKSIDEMDDADIPEEAFL